MAMYSKILIALDFHGDNDEIISKGKQLADENKAELFLIHINEPLAVAYAADGMSWSDQVVSLEASIRQEARKKMTDLGNNLKLKSENCITKEGKPASEIHSACKEYGIDLVVMGTHGQHGLQLLLGSSANSVLHGSVCDVLTVRVGD